LQCIPSIFPSAGIWLQGNYNREHERSRPSCGGGQAVAARSGVASTLSPSLPGVWTRHSLQAVADQLPVQGRGDGRGLAAHPEGLAGATGFTLAKRNIGGQQGQGHAGVADRFTTAAATRSPTGRGPQVAPDDGRRQTLPKMSRGRRQVETRQGTLSGQWWNKSQRCCQFPGRRGHQRVDVAGTHGDPPPCHRGRWRQNGVKVIAWLR
jgi:hypothetical protein